MFGFRTGILILSCPNSILASKQISLLNIKYLVEELQNEAKKDHILSKYYKKILYAIHQVKSNKLSNEQYYTIESLHYNIKNWITELNKSDDYLDRILSELKILIDKNDLEQFQNIDTLTNSLVSQLVYLGIHPRSLAAKMNTVFLPNGHSPITKSFDDCWSIFLKFINDETYTIVTPGYLCVLPTDKLQREKFPFNTDILSLLNREEILKKVENKGLTKTLPLKQGNYLVMRTEVFTHNVFRSVEQAMVSLEQYLAMMAFNDDVIRIDKGSIIVLFKDCPSNEKYKIIFKQNLFGLGSNKKRNLLIKDFFKIQDDLSGLSRVDQERVNSSLRNYSIASSSYSPETSFLMLWSSLESLLKIGTERSNIDHIIAIIPRLLSLKYVQTLLDDLFSNLFYANIKKITFMSKKDSTEISFKLVTSRMDNDTFLNFIKLFTNDSYDIVTDMSNYSLLEKRIDFLRNSLCSTSKCKSFINNHTERITWHIHRLYRVRNRLVHSAQVDSNIAVLSEHLDFYVREILTNLLNYDINLKEHGLGSSLISIKNKYNYLMNQLSNEKWTDEIFSLLFPNDHNFVM